MTVWRRLRLRVRRLLRGPEPAAYHREPPREGFEEYVTPGGLRLHVHAKWRCRTPDRCVIHNPSDHHMRTWPMIWRFDRGIFERRCPHGIGHPDPDGLLRDGDGVHGCDGCCRAPAGAQTEGG